MSTEWALLENGKIVNVVMSNRCKAHMQEAYPDYEVAHLYSLPVGVVEAYRYWRERP